MTAPKREQYGNFGFTTLNGNINNSTTSITVTDGSVFPSAGNFRVRVAQEIMLCTARSGNTLTVVRGIEGTAPVTHSDLENITSPFTVASFNNLEWENDGLFGYSSVPPVGVISNGSGGLLTVSDFSWVNQGGATAVDQNGTILLTAPPASGENGRILVRSAPATPWTLIAAFEAFAIPNGGVPNFGVIARQISSGKFFAGTFSTSTSGGDNPWSWGAYTFASATSFNSTVRNRSASLTNSMGARYYWLKLLDDGTDLKYYAGTDGVNWQLVVTHDRDSYMTSGGPDQFGFYANNHNSSSGYDMLARLVHWSHS